MKTSPSLSDIAKRAKVSTMTVSLALRNDPRVAEDTKLRIQTLATEMGYKVNPLVAALMASVRAKRQGVERAVIAMVADQRIAEVPTFKQYLLGSRDRAEELGFKLDLFHFGPGVMSESRLNGVLYARGVVGVLMAPLFEPGLTVELDWQHFSAVALGYSMPRPQLHRVVNHQFHSMLEALNQLEILGYRRPGLVLAASDDERVDHNWLAAYLTHTHLQGRRGRPRPLVTSSWSRKLFTEWLESNKPDVVVTVESSEADLHSWIESLGIAVPDELGYAVVNREPDSGNVAGVDQNSAGVGAAAIDIIVGQLHRNQRGVPRDPRVTLIEGKWVDGVTVRAQAPACKP